MAEPRRSAGPPRAPVSAATDERSPGPRAARERALGAPRPADGRQVTACRRSRRAILVVGRRHGSVQPAPRGALEQVRATLNEIATRGPIAANCPQRHYLRPMREPANRRRRAVSLASAGSSPADGAVALPTPAARCLDRFAAAPAGRGSARSPAGSRSRSLIVAARWWWSCRRGVGPVGAGPAQQRRLPDVGGRPAARACSGGLDREPDDGRARAQRRAGR